MGLGSVFGGELCNLHVEFEAVVEPDDEDDCNDDDEKSDSPCTFCDGSIMIGLLFIAIASASCIRHKAPELTPLPSCIEISALFNVDFNFPLSFPVAILLFIFEGHRDECCSTGGKFLGRVDDVFEEDEKEKLSFP